MPASTPLHTRVRASILEHGFVSFLRLLFLRVSRFAKLVLAVPGWLLFLLSTRPVPEAEVRSASAARPGEKEAVLRSLIAERPGARFLEVGLGEFPSTGRLSLLASLGSSYTGLDFPRVCRAHRKELAAKGVSTAHARFIPNEKGTYAWTMFELLREDERFDLVFLDGHHTFYVDLPALLLADKLLRPGGILVLDDTAWTLRYLIRNMRASIAQWAFYHAIYRFQDYSPAQQKLPHIGMMAEELLLKTGAYERDQRSLEGWWILRKN